MQRLPMGWDALSLLESGDVSKDDVRDIALHLACFHRNHSLGSPAPFSPKEWFSRQVDPALDCLRETAKSFPEDLKTLEQRMCERADELRPRFERRRVAGCAVDGHGDLHLQHIWLGLKGTSPTIIDCIAFREDLRRIDRASEVAFLAMDLSYRRRSDLAEQFLREYAVEADDHDLYGVVDFFVGYRAAVRAKVAALASGDHELLEIQRSQALRSSHAHLEHVKRALRSREGGGILAVSGVIGTGKSTVAACLADLLGGVVIASDRVRKALACLDPTDRTEGTWKKGIYSETHTAATYRELNERAKTLVQSGRLAILDATFAKSRHRSILRELADTLGVPVFLFEVRANRELIHQRLEERSRQGRDPSDAGPSLYERSLGAYEPPREWPGANRARIHTDDANWRLKLETLAAARLAEFAARAS